MTLDEKTFRQAILKLCDQGPELAGVVSKWGNPPFWTHEQGFPGMVMTILAQQVSLESARAAFNKLEKAVGTINPDSFLTLADDSLKSIGFSRQKASYVRGLAEKMVTGAFDFDRLKPLGNDAARKALLELRGIGVWTADTYLLFSLKRADAWPSKDLALEKAIQELMNLPSKPDTEEADRIAERWKPYRAVAARILWHHYLCVRGRRFTA